MNRKDEIQELYDISDKISFLSSILFSCNIIVAFVARTGIRNPELYNDESPDQRTDPLHN